MHQLRRFLLLLFLAGWSASAGAQSAVDSTVTAAGSQATASPVIGKAGAATGTGSGPQITCFGGSSVLTCLDNAGGTPFQVNCFGASQYQSCFSFNDTRQFSLSSLGASSSTPSLGASPSDPITGAGSKSPTGTNRH